MKKHIILACLMLSVACACVWAQAYVELKGAGQTGHSFVYMNIPYSRFFENEYKGGADVDAVSSATMKKTANANLAGGSYHTPDNSRISGVSYPVAVPPSVVLDADLRVNDLDALFDAPDYAYVELDYIPAFYKILYINAVNGADTAGYAFTRSTGNAERMEYGNVELKTSSVWGDYVISFNPEIASLKPFAAILRTQDGAGYGVRILENIWRGFEIGITTTPGFVEPHGNTLAYEPYVTLPGRTIREIVYFTPDGMKVFDVDLYVPYKFENTLSVEDAPVSAGTAAVSIEGFPADYDMEFSVSRNGSAGGPVNGQDIVADGSSVTWTQALAGVYTLTVSDRSGKYAPYTTTFVLSTDTAPVAASANGLAKAEGASDEEFSAYIQSIASVQVNGNAYAASGKRGTVIVLDNGTIDRTKANVFSEPGIYTLRIIASGYPDVVVTVVI